MVVVSLPYRHRGTEDVLYLTVMRVRLFEGDTGVEEEDADVILTDQFRLGV